MRAAASLAHDLPEGDAAKKRVRRLLESQLKDPVLQMRRAAASSLGTLGDASARPALERAAAREDYPSVTQAAEGALQAIARNQGKDAAPDELRQQLEELQRDQRDLKRDLERLRKQVEAAGADSTRVQ